MSTRTIEIEGQPARFAAVRLAHACSGEYRWLELLAASTAEHTEGAAMDEPNYWRRWVERRLSRRRLLGGAAGVGAGLAAISLVGCGGENGAPSASPDASPGASPGAGSPAATPQSNVFFRWGTGPRPALEPAHTRGGMQRWFGYEAITLDTFDLHQSQFGPASHPQSTVYSRVLKYWDVYAGRDRARPGGGDA
jgi:hypothetical protein